MKMKQLDDGLYLKPYQGLGTLGEGMYLKNEGSYDIVKDVTKYPNTCFVAFIGPPA